MKILAIRHGHKSEEDLSEEWIQQSIQVGEKIGLISKDTLFLSSPSKRVKDTVRGVLRGANYEHVPKIRERHYLGLDALPPVFHEKNSQRRSVGLSQDNLIWEFLRWEWSEIKPKDIAKKFLFRILGLMRYMSKNSNKNIPDIFLGNHQANAESIILTLSDATEIPDVWKTPIWFAEFAEFEISMKDWSPCLIISYRGHEKVLSYAEIRELYNRLYETE